MAKGTCSVEGCDRPVREAALCGAHYARLQTTGDVRAHEPIRPVHVEPIQRFWTHIDKNGIGGCWLWTASHNGSGYGQFDIRKHGIRWRWYAHRLAYELLVGPIPPGLTIDHLCKNPACCNPAHLEAVPERINLLRSTGMSARNAVKTHCPQGHLYDEANTYHTALGARVCRACRNDYSRKHHAKKRDQQ